MAYTNGDWVWNKNNNSIESTTEWVIKPDKENDEDGVPVQVISTFSAMGGDDTKADIQLICSAPKMLQALYDIVNKYDIETGGVLGRITYEEVEEIKKVIKLAVGS
jgi:hypothetical protein